MGTKQLLRAATLANCAVIAAASIDATYASPAAERTAIIDLGPANAAVREGLFRAVIDANLAPITGEGVEDALTGIASDRDTTALKNAMALAQRSVEKSDCAAAMLSARRALLVIAARQASGLAVPELPRAWSYILVCADRSGDIEAARRAAHGIRSSAPPALPHDTSALLAKYPEVDAVLGADSKDIENPGYAGVHSTPVEGVLSWIDISTEDGAVVWVDFQPAGTAPLRVALDAGEHVIAAATGSRRGSMAIPAGKAPQALAIALEEQRAIWTAVANKVANWRGKFPSSSDLAWVLDQVHARIAMIRSGDRIEAWGRAGSLELPRRLGGAEGAGSIADADRVAKLLVDAVQGFSSRAPDSTQPLLVDAGRFSGQRRANRDEPTKWWVYAAIGAAFAASAAVVYFHYSESNVEHLELHYP